MSYFLNPLFWIFTTLIIAYFLKNKIISRKLFLISLIVFYLFSNRFICDEFIRIWEVNYNVGLNQDIRYDAAIVLGGGIANYDYLLKRIIFRQNTDKLLQAVDLYKRNKVKKILLSGGPGHLIYRDQYEAAFLKSFLIKIDIPPNDILVDSLSDNTHISSFESKRILFENFKDGGNNLLITNAMHMRRSIACFKKAGVKFTAYPVNRITSERIYNFDHLFMPHLDSFEYWSDLFHEWVGYIIYKFMGYL